MLRTLCIQSSSNPHYKDSKSDFLFHVMAQNPSNYPLNLMLKKGIRRDHAVTGYLVKGVSFKLLQEHLTVHSK